jgi:hypothetical protein
MLRKNRFHFNFLDQQSKDFLKKICHYKKLNQKHSTILAVKLEETDRLIGVIMASTPKVKGRTSFYLLRQKTKYQDQVIISKR